MSCSYKSGLLSSITFYLINAGHKFDFVLTNQTPNEMNATNGNGILTLPWIYTVHHPSLSRSQAFLHVKNSINMLLPVSQT